MPRRSSVAVAAPVAPPPPPAPTSANLCCPSAQMRYAGRLVSRVQKTLFAGLALDKRSGSAYEFFLQHGGVRLQIHAIDGTPLPVPLIDEFQAALFGAATDIPVTHRLTATAVDATERVLVPATKVTVDACSAPPPPAPPKRRARRSPAVVEPVVLSAPVALPSSADSATTVPAAKKRRRSRSVVATAVGVGGVPAGSTSSQDERCMVLVD